MTDYKNKFPESFKSATEICDLIEKKINHKGNIISIIGGWGTGKSTIKEIICSMVIKKYNFIKFDAIEFEEKSQVTSELYNTISKSFPSKKMILKYFPINLCIWSKYHKFRAIGQLKKESNAQNLSTTFILGILIVGICGVLFNKLINKLTSSSYINNMLGQVPYFLHNDVNNPVLINKVILVALFLLTVIAIVDYLLKIFSGLIPRKSHISIIKNIRINKKTILMIDEIDRLSEDSIKYLLNEIDSLSSIKNLLILFFYDKKTVLEISKNASKQITLNYLQKFYDYEYVIKRYPYIKTEQKQYLYIVWQFINSQILSFRDGERFVEYLESNYNNLYNYISSNDQLLNSLISIISMQIEKAHIRGCIAFINPNKEFASIIKQDVQAESELIINNIIKLVLYFTFRYEYGNYENFIEDLKQTEPFREIVRIECYDMNKPLFFPSNQDIENKINGSSSIVIFVNNLWYGLIQLNLCSYRFKSEKSIDRELEKISKSLTDIAEKTECMIRSK